MLHFELIMGNILYLSFKHHKGTAKAVFVFCLVVVDGLVAIFINFLGVVLFAVFCGLGLVWAPFGCALVVQAVASSPFP